MGSKTVPAFWEAYAALPPEIRQAARKAYRLWLLNPRHPSLRFEPKAEFWSVRITQGWRALGRQHEGVFYWFWIGSHDEYMRLLRR